MTGLEKILGHIEEDAVRTAEGILKEAEQNAEEIMEAARSESEKKCAEIMERSSQEVKSCLIRGESAANLQKKKLILNVKQEIISNLIEKSKEALINLPEQDYFKAILQMIQKNALPREGVIVFSEKDLKRLPEGFSQSINSALKDREGAILKLAEDTCNIKGGFILTYGDVEINCSFEALFAAARESLQDKVCEVLFG